MKTRSKTKFPGITKAAIALGVSREHLYRVLIGERTGSLKARYETYLLTGKTDSPKRNKARLRAMASGELFDACVAAEEYLTTPESPAQMIKVKNLLRTAIQKAKGKS